jgi:hypothetical protein
MQTQILLINCGMAETERQDDNIGLSLLPLGNLSPSS